MYMRLYRDKRTLRPFILPTVGKGERGEAKRDRDGEGPKGGSRD
jgi:hypothetical protein